MARDPIRALAVRVVADHRRRRRHELEEFGYDVEDVEALLRAALGTRCPYCGVTLTADNCSVDYRTPIALGGAHQLANLQVLCKRRRNGVGGCNVLKGSLRAWEFGVLCKALGEMTPEGRQLVESALLVRGKVHGRRG